MAFKLAHQVAQLEQTGDVERGASGRHHDERVRRHHIGPLRRQRDQLISRTAEVDEISAPALAALDELEFSPRQWMERMSDPEALRTSYIVSIKCT